MEYLHVFESETDYNTARSNNYSEPWVSATNMGGGGVDSTPSYRVDYNKSEYEKLLEIPLTFEIISDGNIVWQVFDTAYTVTLDYKKNDGEWSGITSTTGGTSISVSAGDTIQFRCGTDDGYATMSSGSTRYNTFYGTTAGFKLKGNIMSLLSKNNFASIDTLQSANTFANLFMICTGLTDASKLVLPATTLAENCYQNMFVGCNKLTKAPELPATTLAQGCYNGMFNGCTSLTSSPSVLPATTLVSDCYSNMFNGCRSLTTTPELPATTLAQNCYQSMFRACASLTTAPELPATTLADGCYSSMFYGCTSLTTAPELPATTLADGCYNGMFFECTSLTTAPELPATTLADGCYKSMFFECTNLTTAPELPATTLADGCYYGMFSYCENLTTAPDLPATNLVSYCYQNMFQHCNNLNYIKAMFTTTPGSSYTNNWVDGVASTGTFVKNSAATWNVTGGNGVPNNWTVETATS